jgi:type IV secretory pathway VirB10-like protein
MDNPQPTSEAGRLDRLEKKELALESELSRLDKEEKDLERRLTELELKEIELAKSVSRLTQVKARRPEFLMNYMKTAKKHSLAGEAASAAPAANQVQAPAPAPLPTPAPAPAATQMKPPAPAAPAPAQPTAPAQITPETKPVAPAAPSSPQPAAQEAPAATAQTLLPPHIEEKKERKQILEAQIKNVLKKQEMKKKEDEQKQGVLDAKAPIRKLNLDGKMSESADLFKLLLSRGAMTLEEAGKIMKADKDALAKAAKDLEDSGLIEVNRPLYGSPKIRLKSLTEGMEKPQEKK